MSTNQVRVRRLEKPKSGSRWKALAVFTAVAVGVLAVGATAWVLIGGIEPALEITEAGGKKLIKVPAGGNVQAAINRASGGDVILLEPGANYGEIMLPNKNIADYITIQSSAADQLAADVRVSPQQSRLMPKVIARGGGKSALATEDGAHHYRFVGVEFTTNATDYVYNLVYLGASTANIADIPHDLEFDRCLFRSSANNITRRGLALNSAATVVKNSYFEGFSYPSQETQGICGWTGTRNVKIINNYVEGGAENIMFGGSDPANAELIPQDIEIRGNRLSKPAAWKGKNSMKCLFEIKNAKRLQFTGNFLENNWVGSAFRITVRNDGGTAPFSTIEDVVVKDNVIVGAGAGVNILGRDDIYPSQTLKRLTVSNNLFLNIDPGTYEGNGYFVQISEGDGILISNNTSMNRGNIVTFHGTMPKNLRIRDNIVGHGDYGVHGLASLKSPEALSIFQNNVFVNNRRVPPSEIAIPSGNFLIGDYESVGFVNLAGKDFNLAPTSRFKGKAANKGDIGYRPVKLADFR